MKSLKLIYKTKLLLIMLLPFFCFAGKQIPICQGDQCTSNSSCIQHGKGACYQFCKGGICRQCNSLSTKDDGPRCIPSSVPICRGPVCSPNKGACPASINNKREACYINCISDRCEQCGSRESSKYCLKPEL